MFVKTLLTVQPADEPLDALKPAIDLARRANAHLNVIVVSVLQTVPFSGLPGGPRDGFGDLYRLAHDHAHDFGDEVEEMARDAALPVSVLVDITDPSATAYAVSRHSFFADITVLPIRSFLSNAVIRQSAIGVLLRARLPVLFIPSGRRKWFRPAHTIVAWSGRPQEVNAVQWCTRIMTPGDKISIVSVDPDEAVLRSAQTFRTYLTRYGFQVLFRPLNSNAESVALSLMEHADETGADLLAMGAYGHSRLREWFFGGVTREMLYGANLPILMSH